VTCKQVRAAGGAGPHHPGTGGEGGPGPAVSGHVRQAQQRALERRVHVRPDSLVYVRRITQCMERRVYVRLITQCVELDVRALECRV
jgi:hypothetical protein